jgi:pyruvate formate lyase activating enzyme
LNAGSGKFSRSRRDFLRASGAAAAGLLAGTRPAFGGSGGLCTTEARYYAKMPDKSVRCDLCPRRCRVESGGRGFCQVRANRDGVYYSLVYGRVAAMHNDPVEKKPFFHFLPGSTAISIATVGCNLDCKFCQNWDLSRRKPEEADFTEMNPEAVAETAVAWGCRSVAYTYNEPVVFAEFVHDTAEAAAKRGVRSVVVSNGFIRKEPLADLARVVDAVKVDLKAFRQDFYRDVTGGSLQPVLDTLVLLSSLNVWTEIVYLVIPGLNDDPASLKAMTGWILRELGPDVPLHFSRFYPQYKLKNLPPTPLETLDRAWTLGKEAGLHFVYLGNVPGHPGENTVCPGCGKTVIERRGFQLRKNRTAGGKCGFCGRPIPGVWTS